MRGSIIHKIWDILSYVLAAAVLVFGTIFAYYYANGYRFNIINGEVKQTGVISVQPIVAKTQVYIDGKDLGKSPKVTAKDIGESTVKVTKEGYYDWEKIVPVIAEKSTALEPILFLKNIQAESVYSTSAKILKQVVNPKDSSLLSLIQTDKEYKIIKYETQKSFWNISENPFVAYTTPITNIKTIDVQFSKDGLWALVTKTLSNKSKEYEFVRITQPADIIKDSELTSFNDYTINWSENSNFIILESKQDIIAYKFSDSTKYLLLKKTNQNKIIWTTDSDGFFYYADISRENDLNKFSLIQSTLQGNAKKTILKDVYLQATNKYIEEIKKEDISQFELLTNSKENTRFGGDILAISVIPNSNGVFITTSLASYWYDQTTSKYVIIDTNPSTLYSVSPDNTKLIYKLNSADTYGVFVFKKIEADPLTKLGSKEILPNTKSNQLYWGDNSINIFYENDGQIYSIEFDGANSSKLIEYHGIFVTSKNSEFIYQQTKTQENDNLEVLRYKLY